MRLKLPTIQSKTLLLTLAVMAGFQLSAQVVTSNPVLSIPDNNPTGINDTITISGSGSVVDLIIQLDINHTYVGDLTVTLKSPSGNVATLLTRPTFGTGGCSEDHIVVELNDASGSNIEAACPVVFEGVYSPYNPLATFDGFDIPGDWIISVSDNANFDTGILNSWTLLFNGSVPTPTIFYVDQNATGNNDGTSWANAYNELIDATSITGKSDQIWVAAGTYTPDNNSDRHRTFAAVAEMYGGFSGNETMITERDWVSNVTILSGDIGVIGDQTDNSYSVVSPLASDQIVIDGFTISDGYSDGESSFSKSGAGIYSVNGPTPVTLKNCIIKDNMAYGDAGVYFRSTNGIKNVLIENVRFKNNKSRWAASFTIAAVGGTVNADVVNCLIDNNQTIDFDGELANTMPGGRFIQLSDGEINGRLINCTFSENIDNSVVDDSSKSVFGVQGALSTVEVFNTIFWDNTINPNTTSIGYGTSVTYIPDAVNVFNTISQDVMSSASYITTTNNTQIDPLFVDPSTNNFSLQATSPALNVGDTTGISHLIPLKDLGGNDRYDGIIDLGCYEGSAAGNVSVNELSQSAIKLFPNPTNGILNIVKGFGACYIIDVTGKVVFETLIENEQIDVSAIENGVYILVLESAEGLVSTRFIKR